MMRKSYFRKLACMAMLLTILLAYQNYTSRGKESFPDVKFIMASSGVNRSDFDPNTLDETQWQKLGFSEKQVSTILKYKEIVGGQFISKQQLKKCYAISEEKFAELKPYIILPEDDRKEKSLSRTFEKKTITIPGKFNPDRFSANDWIKMGFSERQAAALLKYKNYLGGSFISKEKFKECFIISPENYIRLEPYLQLPEKVSGTIAASHAKSSNIRYRPFDPNTLNADGWKALGFSEKQATTIINYRDRNLRGSFKNPEDLQKCFVISPEKFEELKPYITITIKEEIRRQETDFSKTDLNTISFKQLLEFGLDERSAASIIGFRRKLGGFVNKQQILDTYNIDKDLVQKLISICLLDTSGVQKYTLTDAPEEWLKNHPYFKYSADKIIFYRITYPDDKKIWKFLKLKPEYEEKMRLYIK
nr:MULTISPECIES: helix-hairpin-helix domain-containing protein [Chryseobacterium]